MTTIHNFGQSLAESHAWANAPWWESVYREAFPNLAGMVCVRNDGWAQRGGIDRVLTLSSGRQITIDEKVRKKDWPDILLERWSDEDRKIPGWIEKDLACEFIAYAFIPSATCYLLPTLTLQRAWRMFGPEWIDKYPTKRARNEGWVTASIAVPTEVLLSAMNDAMIVRWERPVLDLEAIPKLCVSLLPFLSPPYRAKVLTKFAK